MLRDLQDNFCDELDDGSASLMLNCRQMSNANYANINIVSVRENEIQSSSLNVVKYPLD